MNRVDHSLLAEWLPAYYDDELDAARRQQVEAHLANCAECREALAGLRKLSEALSADEARDEALTTEAAFWLKLKPRLPDRPLAASPASSQAGGQSLWLRWLPGLGLLLASAAVQMAGVAATVVMLVLSPSALAPAWAASINRLAAGAVMGWPVWLMPAQWTSWGMFALFFLTSAALAVLYLGWLGYELRYGRGTTDSVAHA